MVPEDKRHPGNSDSKTKPNNKLGNISGNPTGSATNKVLDDEIKTLPCTPLAATNPLVAQENGEKFQKNSIYGQLDFQP